MATSAGLITATVASAGSALALDREYQLRRAERRAEAALSPHAGFLGGLGTGAGHLRDVNVDESRVGAHAAVHRNACRPCS